MRALLLALVVSTLGCATAVKQTQVAEATLAGVVAVGYRTFTQYDTVTMDGIASQAKAGKPADARAALDAYKPKRDKALSSLDGGADLIAATDKARDGVEKGIAKPGDYAALLPQLLQAAAAVKQALIELGAKL